MMIRLAALTVAVLAVSACGGRTVVVQSAAESKLEAEPVRITDEVITGDRKYIRNLQERLQAISDGGWSVEDYHYCKAQAWVDLAFNEYNDNDRTGVVKAALAEALVLIHGMEAGDANLPIATPIIDTSRKVRDDLWSIAETRKSATGGQCLSCATAKLEVQLVWVGHEQGELGYRHSLSEIKAAERYARDAAGVDGLCAPLPRVAESTAPAPAPAAVPVPIPDTVTEFIPNTSIPRYVHFALRQDALSDESRAVVREIAAVLHNEPDLRIRLTGHTDVRGMSDYNQALAARRTASVYRHLLNAGIAGDRLSTAVAGPYRPRAFGPEVESHARNRRVEVSIESDIPAELLPQEEDLQVEESSTSMISDQGGKLQVQTR